MVSLGTISFALVFILMPLIYLRANTNKGYSALQYLKVSIWAPAGHCHAAGPAPGSSLYAPLWVS